MRKQKPKPRKFDKEAFWLGVGMGVILLAVGGLIAYSSMTSPDGASTSTPVNTAQRLARVMPQKAQSQIAFWVGASMAGFGVVSIIMGLYGSMKGLFRSNKPNGK